MTQFLNNVWIALSTENIPLMNILSIPLTLIEIYLSMKIFLTIFNVKASKKQQLLYVIPITVICRISASFIPAPLNVILNYTSMLIFMKLVFDFNPLKCFISLIVSSFVFGITSTIMQKPYIAILNITFEELTTVPIYDIPFLALLYTSIFIIILLKN